MRLKRTGSRLVLGKSVERDRQLAQSNEMTLAQLLQSTSVLTRDSILKEAVIWQGKTPSLKQVRSLILSGRGLPLFSSTTQLDLAELERIQVLSLSKNRIATLQFARELTTLLELNLNFNRIVDLYPLSELTRLQKLLLSHNLVQNLSELAQMRELRFLTLYSNRLADKGHVLSVLAPLQLRELDIGDNPCSGKQLRKKLIVLLPKLEKLDEDLVAQKERDEAGPLDRMALTSDSTWFRQKDRLRMGQEDKPLRQKELQQEFDELQTELSGINEEYERLIEENAMLKLRIREAEFVRSQKEDLALENERLRQARRALQEDHRLLQEEVALKPFADKLFEIYRNQREERPQEETEARSEQLSEVQSAGEEAEEGLDEEEREELGKMLARSILAVSELRGELAQLKK